MHKTVKSTGLTLLAGGVALTGSMLLVGCYPDHPAPDAPKAETDADIDVRRITIDGKDCLLVESKVHDDSYRVHSITCDWGAR